MMAGLKIVPLLSRRACCNLAGWAGALGAMLDRRGRKVALANLEAAFGDEFSPERRGEIVRESYEHFTRTMLDLFWSPRLTRENLSEYVEFENIERMRAEIGPTESCIFCAFHYSNFEWLSLGVAWLGLFSAVTTQEFKNPLIERFFATLREQSGHNAVPRQGAIVRLYKTLRKKGRVALLVDTTLPAHQPTVVIECFGLKTMITVAHAWLWEKTGAPLVPIFCEPLAGGRYRVVTHPVVKIAPGATHQEIAQACWDSFEPIVRRNPGPWLWMYKHWRYRPVGATNYPFYSNESPAFEQVAARPDYAKLDRSALSQPAQPIA